MLVIELYSTLCHPLVILRHFILYPLLYVDGSRKYLARILYTDKWITFIELLSLPSTLLIY